MEASILEYGAISDGVTLNTKAIQRAINEVAAAGGGKVIVPTGTFYTGTIYMESHVELHLEQGACLLASEDFADYNPDDAFLDNRGSAVEQWQAKHLIIAYGKEDISITGPGTINGNGEFFFEEKPHPPKTLRFMWYYGCRKAKDPEIGRPGQLIAIVDCKNARFTDFNMVNYPCWGLFLRGCENVQVRGLRVKNSATAANTDGIDIDSSRFVTVSDCIFETGDDAIAIRCAALRGAEVRNICEYITVTNCIFSCSACGIRFGVGRGEIRNVTVSNIVIHRAGCAFELMTAYKKKGDANLSSIRISNVIANEVSFPLRLTQWNNSTIRDVTVTGYSAKARCGLVFEAEQVGTISNVRLNDVEVVNLPAGIPMDEFAVAEKGEYLLFAHGAKGLTFENVRIHLPEELASTWKGISEYSSCEDVVIRNCNFS